MRLGTKNFALVEIVYTTPQGERCGIVLAKNRHDDDKKYFALEAW